MAVCSVSLVPSGGHPAPRFPRGRPGGDCSQACGGDAPTARPGGSTGPDALPELCAPERPREGAGLRLPPPVPTRGNRSPPAQGSCCGNRADVPAVPRAPEVLGSLSFSVRSVSRHTTLETHLCLESGKGVCCKVDRLWAFSAVVSVAAYGRGYQNTLWNRFPHLTGEGPQRGRRSRCHGNRSQRRSSPLVRMRHSVGGIEPEVCREPGFHLPSAALSELRPGHLRSKRPCGSLRVRAGVQLHPGARVPAVPGPQGQCVNLEYSPLCIGSALFAGRIILIQF